MYRKNGNIIFETEPVIASFASAVGKKEGEGPLGGCFDRVIGDSYAGKDTFEQAESELTSIAVRAAINKRNISADEVDIAFCGDLLNQCVASSFAMRPFGIPYAGLYGACSTMGLGLIMAASAVEGGIADRALCAASSHYCTAERQYRFPLEYGSQRPPTAQWTVTAAGACILEAGEAQTSAELNSAEAPRTFADVPKRSEQIEMRGDTEQNTNALPRIRAARIGRITDFGIADQNNMGAAMAPANVKTGT